MSLTPLVHYLFRTKQQLTQEDAKQGARWLTMDGVCSMSMSALQGGAFLPAFALAPGASNYDIGLLTTIVFFSQMMQLPGLLLMRACPVRRSLAVIVAALARSLWVLIIFIPLFFLNRGVTFLIQWLFISSFIGAAAGALSPMVAGIFADFFASRELAISVNWAEPEKAFAMHAMNKQDELYPLRLLTARNARFQNEFGRFTNYKRRI